MEVSAYMASRLLEIQTADVAGAPMQSRQSVRAIKGVGLEGDRYAEMRGSYSQYSTGNFITVMTADVIERIRAVDVLSALKFAETRRNLLVDLDDRSLVELRDGGFGLRIGGVNLRLMQQCSPCERLAHLVRKPEYRDVLAGMLGRFHSGLFAAVWTTGVISVGDEVEVVDEREFLFDRA